MVSMSRLLIQLLCLFSYLWTSTALGDDLLIQRLIQQDPHPLTVMLDRDTDVVTIHHRGHRDQHEPQAQDTHQTKHKHSDHIVKLVCVDHEPSWLATQPPLNKVQFSDVLWVYLPPPFSTYTETAKTLLLAQQPPPLSRNSALAIVQLTRLRI